MPLPGLLPLLRTDPLGSPVFSTAFDEALRVKYTNVNLTMGLFWIRPRIFLNLDKMNRAYLGIKLPPGGLSATFSIQQVNRIVESGKSFLDVSFEAWSSRNQEAGQ